MPGDFPAVFAALRDILRSHAKHLVVLADTPTEFSVASKATGPSKKPLWFGAGYLKKSAVTYHLMPLYFNPALEERIPETLRVRKQGKACFNFRGTDAALFSQLAELTSYGLKQWQRSGFLEAVQIPRERFEEAARNAGATLPERPARTKR